MPQLADAGAAPALAVFPQGVLARNALRAPGEDTSARELAAPSRSAIDAPMAAAGSEGAGVCV
jgi:hypothetical protein